MKLNITGLNVFIFCLLSALTINIGVAQNTPLNGLADQDSLQLQKNDELLRTPFGVFNLSQTTGAVFRISGDQLRKTGGDNLSEALIGRVPGLRIIRQTNTPGTTGNYQYVLNGGTPYVLIDGQPRGLQVDLREVEEVLVLNDGTFNSSLGNFGDNGLIYVITKGGQPDKPVVEVNYQRGHNRASRLPSLLSSAEYATVVNQASNNDGLGDIYRAEAIAAYRDGSDPINFPNVNTQDIFIEDSSPTNFASLNTYGGTDDVSYGAFLGYSDWRGLEKVGTKIKGRNLTFRTKINTRINDLLRAHASVYGKFGQNERPIINADELFLRVTATPANAFPLKVGDSYIVSREFDVNLLSELEAGGIRTDYAANMVFDIGLDFDFKDFVPGLKYDTYAMLRTFNQHSLVTNNTPATFTIEPTINGLGEDDFELQVYETLVPDLNIARNNAGVERTFTYGGNLSYFKKTNESALTLNLSHLMFFEPTSESTQPDRRNLTFNVNGSFALQNKYIAFANINSSSSSKFIGDNRTNFFPTLGFAWVASNEDFLKDNKNVDFLKFRTSYGQIGTEYTADTFLFLDTWGGGTGNLITTYLGQGLTGQNKFGYSQSTTANEAIDWVVYNQLFLGAELSLYKKLKFSFNYFDIEIQNQITNASELFASALGNNVYLPALNFTDRRNKGFNSNITFQETEAPIKYYVGINAGYNKIIGEKISEVQHADQYRLQQGEAEDNILGYVSDGLFTAENIGTALPQFGEVQIGDVKYVDQNGDNVIDSRDQRAIGNQTPRFNYGITAGVKYKGFNLDVVGAGVAGYDIDLSSSSYYTHGGLRNYYGSVLNDLPNGNANPRLSTITSVNNNRTSDYWLVDGGYFRISNVELGYTLPKTLTSNGPFKDVKLFLRGNNLALFSKLDDLDPEDLRSGFFEYPMMRSFILGASLNF